MSRRSVLVVVSAVLVLAVLIAIVLTSDQSDATALELLRILFGWPVIVGALLLTFGIVFRAEFSQFLQTRGWSIRFPGGAEFRAPQPPSPPGDAEEVPGPADAIKEELEEEIQTDQTAITREMWQGLVGAAMEQHMQARLWFFRYLSVFLVQTTQLVLMWISNNAGTTHAYYEQFWNQIILDANQRALIMDVLMQFNLVEESDGLIRVTPLGEDFLKFISGRAAEALRRPGQPPMGAVTP